MGLKTSNKSTFELLDLTETDTVNAGATKTVTVTADEGEIWIVRDIRMSIPDPAGSSSGNHLFYLRRSDTDVEMGYLYAAFGNNININDGALAGAGGEEPTGSENQRELIRNNIYITSTLPFQFHYYNNTDVNQTGTRLLKVLIEKVKEGV